MNTLRRIFPLIIAVFALLWLAGCKKDRNEYEIPNVYVDVIIHTSLPQYSNLNAVGGWAYVNAGYKGIVVYRNGPETFSAYDRACTFEPTKPCEKIDVEPNGLLATDNCCSSQFQLTDGTVVQGPAFRPLKRYNTFWDGNNLRIYN